MNIVSVNKSSRPQLKRQSVSGATRSSNERPSSIKSQSSSISEKKSSTVEIEILIGKRKI